jgi:hypothetical protein
MKFDHLDKTKDLAREIRPQWRPRHGCSALPRISRTNSVVRRMQRLSALSAHVFQTAGLAIARQDAQIINSEF